MASVEEQALELLKATQSPADATRKQAEQQLDQLKAQDDFAKALVTIASHQDVTLAERLSALINLKRTVAGAWSASQDDYEGGDTISTDVKEAIRQQLLSITFTPGADTKITGNAANVIAKIAKSDFPEEWPGLLDGLIGQIGQSTDDQIHAILVVMTELLDDGFDEHAFYNYANAMVGALHGIATDGGKKLMVRAHAVNIFRQSFDFVDDLKDKEETDIRQFTQTVVDAWAPFCLQVVQSPLPALPSADEEDKGSSDEVKHWQGVVSLKVQVLLTLARIQSIFPDLMPAQQFFEASWSSIQANSPAFYESFVEGERQGSLIDQYSMPFTLDLLVIEEIDYLQTLLEAPVVQEHLRGMTESDNATGGSSVAQWISSVLQTLIRFSAITTEAESLWEIDYNVFLSEETFAETNNTPRSVCAGFVWKISSWFPKETIEGLLTYTKAVFDDSQSPWRMKEAALFTLQQIAEEFSIATRGADINVVKLCIEVVHPAMNDEHIYLRARAHITMAAILKAWSETLQDYELVVNYANLALNALSSSSEDLVKAACIRILREYLTTLPAPQATQLQPRVVSTVSEFLETQDLANNIDDYADLVDVTLQTIRDTIMANPTTCLDHNALDVLLSMVKYGAARDQNSSILIDEAFESAAESMAELGGDYYERLCRKVLPSLMAAFDVEEPDSKQLSALTDVAISVVKILAEFARQPLPQGFVPSAMPRICRLILSSEADFYQRQTATLAIKHMLMNDKDQVFNWVDPATQKNGLEMCFLVIGHLLGPVDDASAAEVGELAVTIIEKAGSSALGGSLNELLQIVAQRLSTATHHGLVQSLSMVYARLSLMDAAGTVNFLAEQPINGVPALNLVLQKWLESAAHFAGFEAIRQNTRALVDIYKLHDPRVEQVNVQGDLIPDTSSRIKTRSMAKKAPIQYTQVSATHKIIKILVNELVPYGDPNTAFMPRPLMSPALGSARRRGDSDDEWESDDEDGNGIFGKTSDDETQGFLVEFFKEEGSDTRFQEIFAGLSEEERKRCMDAVEQRGLVEMQRRQMGQ